MKVRKVVFNIDYLHLIAFPNYYKEIIAPYFSFDNLQYGIDNYNTIHESARLIFPNEGFALQFRKEGVTMMYEGDISEIKKTNPVVDIFFDIYEKIKKIPGYSKSVRHKIAIDCVDIIDKEFSLDEIAGKYLKNPYKELKEFGTVFEFPSNEKDYTLKFGNYTEKDIQKFDLSPLKVKFNSDLTGGKGIMCQVTILQLTTTSSFSKFKELLKEAEDVVNTYLNN